MTSRPSRIVHNGAKIRDTRTILNSLNGHFINIVKIVNKLESKESSFSYVNSNLQNKQKNQVFDVKFITPFEVSEIIKKLDTCKATGIDQISASVWKHFGDHIY